MEHKAGGVTTAELDAIDAAALADHRAEPLPPLGPGQAAGLRRVITIPARPEVANTA